MGIEVKLAKSCSGELNNKLVTSCVSIGELIFALIVILFYGIIFLGLSGLIFERKDI